MARIVARSKDADTVWVVFPEELRDDFGLGTTTVAVIDKITITVAHDQGLADAFTRATDATGIGVNILVLDKATGELVDSYSFTNADGNKTLQVDDYFTGSGGAGKAQVRIYYNYMTANNRKQVLLLTPNGLISNNYTLAVEVYPIGGSSDIIDMWSCGTFTYFDNHLTPHYRGPHVDTGHG